MVKDAVPRTPEMYHGHPFWCHGHCWKMQVQEFDPVAKRLIIGASATRVCVTPEETSSGLWRIGWELRHSSVEVAHGCVVFSADHLRAAFGLSDESGEYGQPLIDRYGGDSAEHHRYIRWGDFLNIPCPGTGSDGDPNMSIEIDDQMRKAVSQLLK